LHCGSTRNWRNAHVRTRPSCAARGFRRLAIWLTAPEHELQRARTLVDELGTGCPAARLRWCGAP
jgi:hypothetical protein